MLKSLRILFIFPIFMKITVAEKVSIHRDIKFCINSSNSFPEMGMEETATNLISLYRLINYPIDKGAQLLHLRGPIWKLSKVVFWDISNVSFLETVVHELGHGQRAKELGGYVFGYNLAYNYLPFLPWIPLRGSGANLSIIGYSALTGGLEAENVLKEITRKNLYSPFPNDEITFLCSLFSEPSTFYYILVDNPNGSGGDVTGWLYEIIDLTEKTHYSDSLRINSLYLRIKRESIFFTFLSPPIWQSLYYIGRYIFTDGERFIVSMFKIRRFEFIPALSYGLTPTGTEKYLEIYWRYRKAYGEFSIGYLWWADEKDGLSVGLSLQDLTLKTWKFGIRWDGWSGRKIGFSLESTLAKEFGKFIFSLSFGTKTRGYLQGRRYKEANWIKIGIRTRL